LPPSPALSIVGNCPGTFQGRKLGVLVTDGSDADVVSALREAVAAEGATIEFVAPTAGRVEASDGSWIDADHKVDGGPSVLFDAVAVVPSAAGAEALMGEATARDFAADAFAHRKFIAYVPAASTLFAKAGIPNGLDDGFVDVSGGGGAPQRFIELCRKLRHWPRETTVKAL
jgi:catalase